MSRTESKLSSLTEFRTMVPAAVLLCLALPFTAFFPAFWRTCLCTPTAWLGAHHTLEFDETQVSPEPSILWLTPIALLLLIRRSVRAKRNEPS
jgi:hypothetical protein